MSKLKVNEKGDERRRGREGEEARGREVEGGVSRRMRRRRRRRRRQAHPLSKRRPPPRYVTAITGVPLTASRNTFSPSHPSLSLPLSLIPSLTYTTPTKTSLLIASVVLRALPADHNFVFPFSWQAKTPAALFLPLYSPPAATGTSSPAAVAVVSLYTRSSSGA